MIIEVPFYWVDKYPDRGGSWSPSTAQQLRKLVAAPYLAPI
ncbi:hypothetical protein [Thiolapillus sp.]|nr:hypothetical protein [Thiolapillus sp.]